MNDLYDFAYKNPKKFIKETLKFYLVFFIVLFFIVGIIKLLLILNNIYGKL